MTTRAVLLSLAVSTAVCATAVAAVPGAGTYKGTTNQKDSKTKKFQKVEVKVGAKGKSVKRFRMGFQTTCADGSGYVSGFFYGPAAVGKGGKFSFETDYKAPDLNPNEKADVFVTVSGRFTSETKAKGTATVQANIFKDGATTGALKCKSGKIRFSATR